MACGIFKPRGAQTGDLRKDIEHLLQREIFGAEQVTLAGLAAFGGEQVTCGDIFDSHEIQSGFDVAGHLAVQKIDDELAGGRRLPIAGTNRRGRHYDDDRQSILRRLQGFFFGQPLRTLVMTDHFIERGIGGFRRQRRDDRPRSWPQCRYR